MVPTTTSAARLLDGVLPEIAGRIVAQAGIEPARDPSNEDPAFDRVRMRRASIFSTLAYQRARQGQAAEAAAQRALAELGGVQRAELTDADQPAYNDAAMRTNASRWAVLPAPARSRSSSGPPVAR